MEKEVRLLFERIEHKNDKNIKKRADSYIVGRLFWLLVVFIIIDGVFHYIENPC